MTSVWLDVLPASSKRYEDFMYSSATPLVILDEDKTVLAANDSANNMYHIQVNTDFRDYFNYQQQPEMLDQLFEILDETLFTKGFRLDYLNDWLCS